MRQFCNSSTKTSFVKTKTSFVKVSRDLPELNALMYNSANSAGHLFSSRLYCSTFHSESNETNNRNNASTQKNNCCNMTENRITSLPELPQLWIWDIARRVLSKNLKATLNCKAFSMHWNVSNAVFLKYLNKKVLMVSTAYSSMRQKSKVDQIFPELDEKACDQIPNAGKKKTLRTDGYSLSAKFGSYLNIKAC